jgi:F-type H+-transporting ATPase subunit alpha
MGTIRYGRSTISCIPVIETINSDISEYIATNVISITDGQFYMNKSLFNLTCRPAIDSSLSVTRIGSNAQCKWIKLVSTGIKNELTTRRNNSSNVNTGESDYEYKRLVSMNNVYYQDHLMISEIETTLILLLVYRNGEIFNEIYEINKMIYSMARDYMYLYYIIFISKASYSLYVYSFIVTFLIYLV